MQVLGFGHLLRNAAKSARTLDARQMSELPISSKIPEAMLWDPLSVSPLALAHTGRICRDQGHEQARLAVSRLQEAKSPTANWKPKPCLFLALEEPRVAA